MQETDPRSEAAANEAAQRSKRLFGNQPDGSDGVAKILREAREKKHEEIAKISSRLRIRAIYLQAIEDGRYRDLPGDAYAVGTLSLRTRQYGRHRVWDEDWLQYLYRQRIGHAGTA
jgi:hypothetical protein